MLIVIVRLILNIHYVKRECVKNPIYSMLLLKNEFNQPIVRLGSLCIDGLTPRK